MNICRCGRPRQRLVSGPKSSRPNTGYFTCECDNRFEWENDRGAALLADAGPLCGYGRASVQRSVKKDGPNRGRKFWCCAKPYGSSDRCNFFEFQAASAPSAPRPRVSAPERPPLPGYATHLTDWAEQQRLQKLFDTDPKTLRGDHDKLHVVAAYRITNREKKAAYESCRARIKAELGDSPSTACEGMPKAFVAASRELAGGEGLDAAVGEGYFLHGTQPQHVHDICFAGLNTVFAEDGLVGRGLYHAEDAGKGDAYTTVDRCYAREGESLRELHQRLYAGGVSHPKNVRYALVCRVACGRAARTLDGKTHVGTEGEPLFADATRSSLARPGDHSVVLAPGDAVATFREFVVFDNNQTLVEYLVAYQRTRTLCDCGELAMSRTITKEGPNKGRRMLRCNRGPDANQCSFFTMYPHCDCGESAEKKTSQSASNPGRAYWRCRNRYARCDFFEWCDGRLGSANPSPAKKARTSF